MEYTPFHRGVRRTSVCSQSPGRANPKCPLGFARGHKMFIGTGAKRGFNFKGFSPFTSSGAFSQPVNFTNVSPLEF